jgi:hypothetical protein
MYFKFRIKDNLLILHSDNVAPVTSGAVYTAILSHWAMDKMVGWPSG